VSARADRIACLYERHAMTVERQVSRRARAPQAVIEDACQTAWTRLCARTDIDADGGSVVRWLVVTAMREAWKLSSRQREVPVGGWSSDPGVGELPEPPGDLADPLAAAIDHAHYQELRDQLATLTVRERQFLALQAAGLSYEEISQTGASVRTVERQILRGRRKLREGGPSIDD
jgi:RNA polymerase sigma factor (sigma-70 family)